MLSQPQTRFFETFGFLTLPDLFADDTDQVGDDPGTTPGTFDRGPRRRLFTLNFREAERAPTS